MTARTLRAEPLAQVRQGHGDRYPLTRLDVFSGFPASLNHIHLEGCKHQDARRTNHHSSPVRSPRPSIIVWSPVAARRTGTACGAR
jgi:hypothetical protein